MTGTLEARVARLERLFATVDPGGRPEVEPLAATTNFWSVLGDTAYETGVRVEAILGASKTAASVRARWAATWTGSRVLSMASTEIGRALGRDHSTILLGLKRATHLRATDPAFRRLTDKLAAKATERSRA